MAKMNKGGKLVCEPCGREITVDCCGAAETTIWCCGRPMKQKSRAKPAKKKPSKKK